MCIGIKPRKLLTRQCINVPSQSSQGQRSVDRLAIEAVDY
jgi:hypothetical protein